MSMIDFNEIVCVGAGGHALMLLQNYEPIFRGRVTLRAFVDETASGFDHPVLGVPVISSEERRDRFADVPVFMGIGSGAVRTRIGQQLLSQGARFATLNGAVDMHTKGAQIGVGAMVATYTRVGPNTRLGDFTQVLADLVAHDVQLGNGSTLGVHSSVLGHVEIGENVNIAPRAVICNGKPGAPIKIGDGAIVGVGAVVSRDVPPGGRVVGNPAMSVEDWRALKALIPRTAQSTPDSSSASSRNGSVWSSR